MPESIAVSLLAEKLPGERPFLFLRSPSSAIISRFNLYGESYAVDFVILKGTLFNC